VYSLANSPIGSYRSFHMRSLSDRIQCTYGGKEDLHCLNSQVSGNLMKQTLAILTLGTPVGVSIGRIAKVRGIV